MRRPPHALGRGIAAVALLALTGSASCGDDPAASPDTLGPDALADVAPEDAATDATPADASEPDAADTSTPGVGCTPDSTLVASRRPCAADDDCPCGAHCGLGVCVADCGAGLPACPAAEVCDAFGRCRAPGDTALTPSAAAVAPGALLVDDAVRVPPGGEGLLRLRAPASAVGAVRVVAPDGYDVRCTAGAAFAPECELAAVPAAAEVSVALRARDTSPLARDDEGGAAPAGEVRVYWGDKLASRPVTPLAAPAPAAPPALADLRAHWTGSAVRVGLSLGADALDPTGAFAVPVAAQLYPTSTTAGVLVLVDRFQVFGDSPDATWPLALSYTPATGAAALAPTRRVVAAGALTAGSPIEVLLDPTPTAPLTLAADGRTLSFELDAAYLGLTSSLPAPRARWRVVLQRAGDLALELAPPDLPLPPAPTLPASAASTPTAWETQFQRAMTSWSAVTNTTLLTELVQTATDGPGATRRLDACGPNTTMSTAARDSLVVPSLQAAAHSAVTAQIVAASPGYSVDLASLKLAPMPGLPSHFLPCAANLSAGSGPSNCGSGFIIYTAQLDLCSQMAATYGCEIVELSGFTPQEAEVGLFGPVKLRPPGGSWCTPDSEGEIWGPATKACVVPPVRQCGELVTCADGLGAQVPSFGTDLATSVLPTSGDLRCAGASPLAAAPAADVRRDGPTPPRRGELVDACAADLARLAQDAPTTGGLAALFDTDAPCLDAARHLVALGLSTAAARAHAADPSAPADPRADRFAQRLVAQWLELHAHIALEARERVLPSVITAGTSGGLGLTAPAALERSLAGWNLLLHPRFAQGLLAAAPAALAEPDYRLRWLPALVTNTGDPQQDGLPVTLYATLRAQLELAERLLASRPSGFADLRRVGLVLRLAAPIEALAAALHARATLHLGPGEALAWQDRYDDARARAASALARVSAAAADLFAGRDRDLPTDADLPLYFRATGSEPASRFAAISDYLLGTTPGSPAWATTTVEAAALALDEARAAYLELLDQAYKADLDVEDRDGYYRERYGDVVATFCGVPAGLDSSQLLDGWEGVRGQAFDPATCYMALEDPSCQSDFEIANGLLNRDDVVLALCTVAEAEREFPGALTFRDPLLTAFAADADLAACGELSPCADGEGVCIACGGPAVDVDGARLASRSVAEWAPPTLAAEAEERCRPRYPAAHARIPLPAGGDARPLADPRCYRGTGGELALAVQAAALDVATARSEMNDAREAYQVAMNSCTLLVEGAEAVAAANAAYVVIAGVLEAGVVVANAAANAASAAADCCYALSGVDGIAAAGSGGANLIVAGVGCGLSGASVIAQGVSDALQATLNETERIHETIVRALDDETAAKVCVNDASQHLVGMRTSQLQIDRALHEVDTASFKLRDASAAAGRAYREGRAGLADLAQNGSRMPRPEVWLDRRIDRFRDAMRLARRVTYLAVRALEWEFQASLPDRFDVAQAETPDVLVAALERLRTTSAPSGIAGSSPAELKVVLSLKDHVLQLEDRTGYPADEHHLDAVERLRMMLASPRHAVYDDDGAYLGQALPFALAPLGALGVGDPSGIPILAATDCAERLWSVNASVLGSGTLYHGSDTTFVRVDLLKQNTFYSQWCGDRPEEDGPFQVASVRPGVNLFRDPLVGGAIDSPAGSAAGNERFSRARIEAYLNVSRAALEGDAYQAGATTELAARGLYGQYALFIPKDLIARRRPDGTMSPGLDLWQIDDILLRLDYVSVAKP